MARVPKMTGGKISVTRGIQCSPNFFISFAQPASPYCEDYVCMYTHMWLRGDCIWITVATKSYCEWNIFIQIGSGAKCWLGIYHWGAGLAVNGRIRDIEQHVLNLLFKEKAVATAQFISKFSFLSHLSRKPLLEM